MISFFWRDGVKVPMAALRGRQTSYNISSVCPATAGGVSLVGSRTPILIVRFFLKRWQTIHSSPSFPVWRRPSSLPSLEKKKKKKYCVIRANPIRTRCGFIHPLLGSNSSELLWLISIQRELTPLPPDPTHPPQSVCVVAAAARGAFCARHKFETRVEGAALKSDLHLNLHGRHKFMWCLKVIKTKR